MSARCLPLLLLPMAWLAGCTSFALPPEYAPSKVRVCSRSTPREALELFQHAIWEDQSDVAYEILSGKTKKEYGPWAFWIALALTYPPLETDETVDSSDYFSTEHFLKFAKVRGVQKVSATEAIARVSIEFLSGGNTQILNDKVYLLKERGGWTVGLMEMMECYGMQ